jgi:hypothetical protein
MKKIVLLLAILSSVVFLGCERVPPEKIATGDAIIDRWEVEYDKDIFARPLGTITIYFHVLNTGEKEWRSFRVEFRVNYDGAGDTYTYYEYCNLPKVGERMNYVYRCSADRKVVNVGILEFYCD